MHQPKTDHIQSDRGKKQIQTHIIDSQISWTDTCRTQKAHIQSDRVNKQIKTHIIDSQISWTNTCNTQIQTKFSQIGARKRYRHIS